MKNLFKLVKNADAKPTLFIVPLVWSFIASLFDGISVGMFVPILKGMMEGDFSFIYSNQYVGPIFRALPFMADETNLIRPLSFLVVLMVTFFVAKIATCYLSGLYSSRAAYQLAHKLRESSFKRCITLGKVFFDSNSAGQLHTVISQFSSELSWKLTNLLGGVTQTLPIISYVAIMAWISWKAALVTVMLSPLILIVKPIYRRLSLFSTDNALSYRTVSNHLERVLQGIVTVKANSGEAFEIKKFNRTSMYAYDSSMIFMRSMLLSHTLIKLLMLVSFLLCGGIIMLLLRDDIQANASNYLIYLLIMKRAIDVLQNSGHLYGELKGLTGLIDSINELFDLPVDKFELVDGKTPFSGVKKEIRIEHLKFGYSEELEVLKDVSFSIESGQVVALVGPSGSGKSTVAQLLLRLYDAPEGSILIDGVDIRDYSLQTLREKTAFVSQASNLFDDTLRNNLTYGIVRDLDDEEIIEALVKARLDKFFKELPEGLDTRIGERGIRISGGEAQRVAIARGVLKKVDFFILDEATSALDATTEMEVQAALDEFVKDKTVLVIAHRFSTLKNVDKIITLADGKIVEQGSLEDLLKGKGLFSDLWKAQELFV